MRPQTAAVVALIAATLLARSHRAGAVVKVSTEKVSYFVDGGASDESAASLKFEPERATLDTNLTVHGCVEAQCVSTTRYISSPTISMLQHDLAQANGEIAVLRASVADLSKALEQLRWQVGNSSSATPASCKAIKDANSNAGSGVYTIDPDGNVAGGVPPTQVYCEMDIDGGGWTLVMAIDKMATLATFFAPELTAGINEASLLESGRDNNVAFTTSGCLSSKFMNELGDHSGSSRQYLVWIGQGMFRLSINSNNNFDWFEGIYHTTYTNSYVSQILHDPSEDLTKAARSWSTTDNAMTGRDGGPGGCPGSKSSSYCHYIPDDVSAGCQWAHRHNVGAGQAAGYRCADSSAHASKIWIR